MIGGHNMKAYLSMGMGVNSVAMMLLLLDQKEDFEAIFVDHGGDWPETYEYFDMFQNWLINKGHKKITVLKPAYKYKGKIHDNIYTCYIENGLIPLRYPRWCTKNFKIDAIMDYVKSPCFQMIGIDASESHRAKISTEKGIENRYPLIEHDINRYGCKALIESKGLPVPMKSGCYFCPFQRISQFDLLRRKHPKLFCKVEQLESNNIRLNKPKGKNISYIKNIPIRKAINEDQKMLFEEEEYPPCHCGL